MPSRICGLGLARPVLKQQSQFEVMYIHIYIYMYMMCIYIYKLPPPPGYPPILGGKKRVGPNGPFGGPRCGAWPPGLSTLFGLFWW